jgi:PEP-CTERM motif
MKSLKFSMKPAILTIAITSIGTQFASAGLVWDLRVTAKNSAPVQVENLKAISGTTGDVFQISMFAMVTGTGAGIEGMQSGLGKTITTHSNGFGGNQSAAALDTLFVNTTAALPTAQDLNADGFADYGSTTFTATNSTAGNWFPRTSLSPGFQTNGVAIPNGTEFKLFQFNYTVSAGLTGFASIQWTQQVAGTINSAAYQLDGGLATTSKLINSPVGATGTSLGSPVVISALAVPEPTSFAMLMMGSLGLVGFRRPSFRRSA